MKSKWIVMLAVLALASACSSPPKQNVDGGAWDFGIGSDAGDGADVGDDMGGELGVTFRLTNGDIRPVFASMSAGTATSCSSGKFLEVLQDGVSQALQDDCTRCSCADEQCTLCAFDCAPGTEPQFVNLSSGDSRTFTWDGMFRVEDTHENGGTCYRPQAPTSETLTARFCWGTSFEFTAEPWGEIADVVCEDVEFSVNDREVEFVIESTSRDVVSFTLTNTTEETLYASTSPGSPCMSSQWLRIHENGERLSLTTECGVCACNEVGDTSRCPQPCPAAACAPPSPQLLELGPGASRTFDWYRVAYVDDLVDEMMCVWDRLVVGEVTAELCWGTSFDENAYDLAGERCESIVVNPLVDFDVNYEITE